MILHLALYAGAAWILNHFFNFNFFQVIVVCLLIGTYNMLYTLCTKGLEIHFNEVD